MRHTIISLMFVVLCTLVFWPEPTKATLITIEIEAEVDFVSDPHRYLEGKINTGDNITGWYTYDSSTPDSNPSVIGGRYQHHASPCGIFLSAGGFEFKTDPADVDFLVEITNDYPPNDDYYIRSHNNVPLANVPSVYYISWWLHDPYGNALSTDALPTAPPVLDDWQSNILNIGGGRTFDIWAHVTSAIPEPATVLLIGLGGLFLRKK